MHIAAFPQISAEASFRADPVALRTAVVPPQRSFDSRSLFEGAQEVRIEHFGQEYRLRQTRNGKLILTK